MAPESKALDAIDRRILGHLRRDARMSWRDLGEHVHLSPTSAADRVKRLEKLGVITGYTARIDPSALGRNVRALIDLHLPADRDPAEFEERLTERQEIVFAAYVTGAADFVLLADCEGPEGLDTLVRWLKLAAGSARTETKVVLRGVVG
jgi:Lrp/AsnC family transcriptional regulator, leucine-responsive regulatory protein